MGNIKHDDELLRVHDDGFDVVFNCDNKHQNGVSYHAEKNGKKTKIDPEYAMAALVKKISGGGWPSDLPKPSEGGFGWTEEIEEITTIIDGTFYYADSSDPVELTNEYSLVEGRSYNVTFNGTEYNNLIAFDDHGYISIGAPFGEYDDYPFHIENFEDSSDRSIVFYAEMPGDYSLVVTAANGEVIHKIDKKYLPEAGGGAMVVHFTYSYDEETDTELVTADKTPSDVVEAMKTALVMGVFNDEYVGKENIPLGCATMTQVDQILAPKFNYEVVNQGEIYHADFSGNTDDNLWYVG